MSSPPVKRRSHTYTVYSVFEAGESVGVESGRTSEQRPVESGITCDSTDTKEAAEYEVLLSAYCSISENLAREVMYALRGRMIAKNNDEVDVIYHEIQHAIRVGDSESFPGNLANNTATTAVGIVVERYTVPADTAEAKPTLIAILQHSDYDTSSKTMVTFKTEHQVPASPLLGNSHILIQVNREVLFSGYIIDYNVQEKRWVNKVTSVSVMSGPETASKAKVPAGATVTAGGRVKAAKHTKGKRPAVTIEEGGSPIPGAPDQISEPSTSATKIKIPRAAANASKKQKQNIAAENQ